VSGAILVIAGVLLLTLGLPRLIAATTLAPWSDVRQALDDGTKLEPDRLEQAYDAYGRALSWTPGDDVLLADRARIARRLTRMSDAPAQVKVFQQSALADLRAAAAAAPGNGFVWAMLADAKLEVGYDLASVSDDLKMSWLVGPYKASAMLVRLRIVLARWETAPPELREAALNDFAAAWPAFRLRRVLAENYVAAGLPARAAIRDRLQITPDVLPAFDALVRRITRPKR